MNNKSTGLYFDIEVFPNLALVCAKDSRNGERYKFLKLNDSIVAGSLEDLKAILKGSTIIGYNSHSYDDAILEKILAGASNDEIYRASSERIHSKPPRHRLNSGTVSNSIDVSHLLRNASGIPALKAAGSNLHYDTIGNLPFDPDHPVSNDDVAILEEYCWHDVGILESIADHLRPAYAMRQTLAAEYGITDAFNLSDSNIGDRVLQAIYAKHSGVNPDSLRHRSPAGQKQVRFKYRCPEQIKQAAQSTPIIAELIADREAHQYSVTPREGTKKNVHRYPVKTEWVIGSRFVELGNGGAHSIDSEKGQTAFVKPGKGERLIELDVASMYPSIMVEHQVAPRHLDAKVFNRSLREIKDSRIEAKLSGDKVKADGLKISINAIYGKLLSDFSPFYDPAAQTAVITTGQISICLLAQWLADAGHKIVTINTDAVTALVSGDIAEIVKRWEEATSLDLDETEFAWLLLENVSSRAMRIKDGAVKTKGEWSINRQPTGLLNEIATSKAIITAVEKASTREDLKPWAETFIKEGADFKDFLLSQKIHGGHQYRIGSTPLEKNSRAYWSTDGEPITDVSANGTVTIGEEKVSLLPVMSDSAPDNLDRSAYITKAHKRINQIFDWNGSWNAPAHALIDRGLCPMPLRADGLNFPGQSGQLRSTLKPIDYSLASGLGIFTGVHANNVIVIDVDHPETVEDRELLQTLANSDGIFCWSRRDGEAERSIDDVRQGLREGNATGRAKIIFSAPYPSNLSGSLRRKSDVGSYGKRRLFDGAIEIFYGEKVSVLGESVRDGVTRSYRLSDGGLSPLPSTIDNIVREQFTPSALKGLVEEVTPGEVVSLDEPETQRLLQFCVAQGMSDAHVHRDGIRGTCFLHDHANPTREDLLIRRFDDGQLGARCIKGDTRGDLHRELNDAWATYGLRRRDETLEVAQYLEGLRPEETQVRDLILSSEQNIVIHAPPRVGKTGGAIAAMLTMPRDKGTLLVYVAKHKVDQEAIEQRLYNAGTTLAAENGFLLNMENKLSADHERADLIVTHWSYIKSMSHSREQYGLGKLIKNRSKTGQVIVVVDEYDAFLREAAWEEVSLDGRRMFNKGVPVEKGGAGYIFTKKCGHKATNCESCGLVKNAAFMVKPHSGFENSADLRTWDNQPGKLQYDETSRITDKFWSQIELGEELNHESSPTQFSYRINQPDPKAADLENVGEAGSAKFHTPDQVALDWVRSLTDATLTINKPVLKMDYRVVSPEDIGEERLYQKNEIFFPASACNARTINGLDLGVIKAFSEIGVRLRFMSATHTDDNLDVLSRTVGSYRVAEITPTEDTKQIDKVTVFCNPNGFDWLDPDINEGLMKISHKGITIFADTFKEINTDNWKIANRFKDAPFYKSRRMQIIKAGGDTWTQPQYRTSNTGALVEFNVLSIKGGMARGINYEKFKSSVIPLNCTYPNRLSAKAPDAEQAVIAKTQAAQCDFIQASFRVMSRDKDEQTAHRVLFVNGVGKQFLDEAGNPDLNFLKEELKLICKDHRVYVFNSDSLTQDVIDWAAKFLETGEFPDVPEDLTVDRTTNYFQQLADDLRSEERPWWQVFSSRRIAQRLADFGWTDAEITVFHNTMKQAYKCGGMGAVITEIERGFEMKEAA